MSHFHNAARLNLVNALGSAIRALQHVVAFVVREISQTSQGSYIRTMDDSRPIGIQYLNALLCVVAMKIVPIEYVLYSLIHADSFKDLIRRLFKMVGSIPSIFRRHPTRDGVSVSIHNLQFSSPRRFLGVFAAEEKIPANTFIGLYSGELLTNEEAEVRGRYVGLVICMHAPD